MLRHFIEIAEAVLASGGHVSFEWPRHCAGWLQKDLATFIQKYDLYSVAVDGCACGLVDKNGEPFLKKWQFVTSSERLAQSLAGLRCQHPKEFRHSEISGSKTKTTELYPPKLCHTMLSGLFGHWNAVPAMPCIEVQDYGHVPPGDASDFGNLVPPNDSMPPATSS